MPKVEFQKPEGFYENVEAFLYAVDITEPFILAIFASHLFFFLLIILFRKNSRIIMFIFVFLLGLCYILETINTYLNQNWQSLVKQNYFDKSGLFVCIMIGIPCLVNSCLIVVISICSTISSLTEFVKLKKQKKE
ncbi:unnamed protein product [Blepharisma stoltei]|uniref:Transmembrane protein 18 n=1 Tax=Blepharisma stoltei TaxID=1481888 RepID=A0AAU9IQ59_9CILI|nr:unnamed protein product [Blepharisma stoltei]